MTQLDQLSEKERAVALRILKQMKDSGSSQIYDKLLYQDYEEVPVDIKTFLHDPRYLGKGLVNEEGKFTVFKYWEDLLCNKIFPDPLKPCTYNTLALTGGIGLGKSFVAVICMLYDLYRMLCLKDPYLHYGLQPIDLITFAVMNITMDAARGVAWDKLQQLLQSSPWFMSHGSMKGTTNPTWVPPKGIELLYGSLPRHIIGRAVFSCLDGDTVVVTSDGEFKIKDLVDKPIRVYNLSDSGDLQLSDMCTAKQTDFTDTEYQIELENGEIVKCTPTHRFMLKDGTYKMAKDLTESDVFLYLTSIDKGVKFNSISFGVKIKSIKKVHLDQSKPFYDIINANPYNNFLVKVNDDYIVSHNCFFDEVSFQPTTDVEKQKQKAKELVNTAAIRMQSRFMKGQVNPTLLIIASSKRTENSFMETYIAQKKANESASTYVVDEPQWIIREDKNSKEKFVVAVGNKFLQSEVLPLNVPEETVDLYRRKGYQILRVPIGYYENFVDDIDQSLMDIAGLSTTNATKYINGARLEAVIDESISNPFNKEIIEVGNGKDDSAQYYDFFDISKVPQQLISRPLYIHIDMSVAGDKTGLAGVWQVKQIASDPNLPANKNSHFQLAFITSIKAPKGHQISFEKNRNFIRWLKQQGFNIKGVSTDSFQSVDTGQTLQHEGFNYQQISVDRVNSDRVCLPYQYLRSTIYEERIKIFEAKLLIEELTNLERNNNTGRIDHPDGGRLGSKDAADAVCGAVWFAQQNTDSFVQDYGEELDALSAANESSDVTISKNQITVEFEEALKAAHPLFSKEEGFGLDFGMGKARPMTNYADVTNGLLVW